VVLWRDWKLGGAVGPKLCKKRKSASTGGQDKKTARLRRARRDRKQQKAEGRVGRKNQMRPRKKSDEQPRGRVEKMGKQA